MIAILAIVGLIGCVVVWSHKDDVKYAHNNRIMGLVPIATAILVCISIFNISTNSVPEGNYVTKLVSVTDYNTDESFYYNLCVCVYEDAYDVSDEKTVTRLAYYVTGIVSPDTGQVIDVESDGDAYFGEEAGFYTFDEDDEELEYRTVLRKEDIDISIPDRIRKNLVEFILEIGLLVFSIYVGILFFQCLGKEEDPLDH